jgi:hypothetical protein
MSPPRFLRDPENAGGFVLIGIFRIGALYALRIELGMFRFEGIRDVFQKNQAEDDVLVLLSVRNASFPSAV